MAIAPSMAPWHSATTPAGGRGEAASRTQPTPLQRKAQWRGLVDELVLARGRRITQPPALSSCTVPVPMAVADR